ncbi:hypothetical protein ACWNYI_00460 [Candidatus Vidania fulgoroideorum]
MLKKNSSLSKRIRILKTFLKFKKVGLNHFLTKKKKKKKYIFYKKLQGLNFA